MYLSSSNIWWVGLLTNWLKFLLAVWKFSLTVTKSVQDFNVIKITRSSAVAQKLCRYFVKMWCLWCDVWYNIPNSVWNCCNFISGCDTDNHLIIMMTTNCYSVSAAQCHQQLVMIVLWSTQQLYLFIICRQELVQITGPKLSGQQGSINCSNYNNNNNI